VLGLLSGLLLGLLLVAGAGCGQDEPGGRSLSIVLHHGNNSRPYMPWPEDVAKQVAASLEEVGFRVEIRKEDWASYLKLVQDGKHQMALLGWSADIPDADNFLYVLLDKDNARVGSANNISFYTSEEVHERLVAARRSTDAAERLRLYTEAQEIIAREAPMVPLVYGEKMIAYRKVFGSIGVEPVVHPQLRTVQQPQDGTLVFLRGNDSVLLDPGDATDGESSNVIEQVFDTLLRFQPGSTEVEPSLAVSWTSNQDRTVWTFRLREGVRFHDGAPLDGAAVAGAFERQRDPAHPHAFDDANYAYWKDLFKFVDRVEAGADPLEVVFRLNEPAPPFFLSMLAAFNTSIPSPKAFDEMGKGVRRHPVGTGPFRFVRWDSGVEIELARNDDYWDAAPALARVRYLVSENATVRSRRLLSAEQADLIDNIDPQTLGELEASPAIDVVREAGLNIGYLAMNTKVAPFDDERVRQAVAWAIDKTRIVRTAYKGVAQVATTPVPPTVFGHAAGVRPRADHSTPAGHAEAVAQARRLLREAGYAVDD
jgi:ABC-type transport system substrate-binding protein